LAAITQRPMAMYHSWDSQNAWLRQIHTHNYLFVNPATARAQRIAAMDWAELERSVAGCTACALSRTRTKTVFGVGNRSAEWMLVGEAPGGVGRRPPLLRAQREGVLVLAADPPSLGDVLARLAHRLGREPLAVGRDRIPGQPLLDLVLGAIRGGICARMPAVPVCLRLHQRGAATLAGLLDHLCGEEELLVGFSRESGIEPNRVLAARDGLHGYGWEHDTP